MAQKRKGSKQGKETKESDNREVNANHQAEGALKVTNREPALRDANSPQTFARLAHFHSCADSAKRWTGCLEILALERSLAPGFGREFGRLADLESSMWLPQVEAFEREGKLIVRADLPGLTKDDINVDITDDAIKIRGERRQEKEENEEGYYRSERSYGSFYREIPLPSGVNREEANASFSNGVLEITMPAPARQPSSRRIEIGEGSEAEQPQAKRQGGG